jgi:hypothetical protein
MQIDYKNDRDFYLRQQIKTFAARIIGTANNSREKLENIIIQGSKADFYTRLFF